MKITDEELHQSVKGCIKGDRTCQQVIFKAFYGKMLTVCMRYTRNKDEAQDMVQDGFIKVFDKVKDFGFNGSFEGWMRRIMVNNAIDSIRKSKISFELIDNYNYSGSSDGDDADGGYDGFAEENEGEEGFMEAIFDQVSPEMILEAMESLTPAYRAVFNLYAIENYSHQQIADALGISLGTSKSNYAKAKMNLKKILIKKLNIHQP
jgi:RNA polymerase sigma-70 factor, ECF subfamily